MHLRKIFRQVDKTEEPTGQPRIKERPGWVSPTYARSCEKPIDPLIAGTNRCFATLPNPHDIEGYKVIRTQIMQKTGQEGGKTIMVTSPLRGEGKTTTAVNLAFTFAREFTQTVLLVDCDLRTQRIHGMLGIKSDRGLADYLLNDAPLSDLIIWPCFEKLTLISGGGGAKESAELLGSPRMKELVQEMKTRYPDRYIFLDAPAVLSGADAMALAPQVDYVLMVIAAGSTPLGEVRRALEVIPEGKMLGLILNRYGRG
ncbi:MAG: CpsD/CapB family tyrosine-protein kinase [Syntrophorhabdales bacterium]|jgi:non-specific protein-tyrosine kinase